MRIAILYSGAIVARALVGVILRIDQYDRKPSIFPEP